MALVKVAAGPAEVPAGRDSARVVAVVTAVPGADGKEAGVLPAEAADRAAIADRAVAAADPEAHRVREVQRLDLGPNGLGLARCIFSHRQRANVPN